MTTVLINGVDSVLGARVAQTVKAHTNAQLIGLAQQQPATSTSIALNALDDMLIGTFKGPELVEVLQRNNVATVIHVDITGEEHPAPNREAALQHNVLGSMALFGACASAGVQHVIVRSSTFVYGASPTVPVFVSEDWSLEKPNHSGLLRDYVELDTFATTFARKHPNVKVTVLRCAGFLGNGIRSPLARYLTQPNPMTLIGFEPRIQVLHPDDAAMACVLAAKGGVAGVFNLAANDPIPLNRAIRLTGRLPALVPEQMPGLSAHLKKMWAYDRGFLRYSCVADTRRAQAELEWKPAHSAEETLRALKGNTHG